MKGAVGSRTQSVASRASANAGHGKSPRDGDLRKGHPRAGQVQDVLLAARREFVHSHQSAGHDEDAGGGVAVPEDHLSFPVFAPDGHADQPFPARAVHLGNEAACGEGFVNIHRRNPFATAG